MFWADRTVEAVKKSFQEKIASGRPLIIRDEKTASGRVHVGSMRGVAIHGIISEVLSEEGIANEFFYEINDFDPMDALPVYLDRSIFEKYMALPLCRVPSPDGNAANYAEYFAGEFIKVIKNAGWQPKFYRASELYRSGKFNETIKIALEKADEIRRIYKEVSGSIKPNDWLPLQVICEKCGKIGTTKVTSFDGKLVTYTCEPRMVLWAKGCGHSGRISPFDGNAKLPWKVEWAAKFKTLGVDIEGAGKDHSTRGGARDIANHISREVFEYQPPFDIPYEFLLVGGKKMSASKGVGSSAKEVSDLLPANIFRLLLIGKDPRQAIDFVPDGDTVPVLFDWYDRLADKYFRKVEDDDTRLFTMIHLLSERGKIKERFLPRFSIVAFLVQMPHINIEEEVERMKGVKLTKEDKEEIRIRAQYAKYWLETTAPEDYKYEIQKVLPENAKNFTDKQKVALTSVLKYIKTQDKLDGPTLHAKLHEIKSSTEIEPKEFFSAIYLSFLGRDSGPQAGWFLSVLDRNFLIKRLEEVTK